MQQDSHLIREFPMSENNFKDISEIAYELTGINLTAHKKNMVYGRLARRIRQIGMASFDEYCRLLKSPNNTETAEFINSITTNLTSFFRENHHFDYLKNTVFPSLIKQKVREKRIRIWSAGCSTGEEPYSIAMCVQECLPIKTWDIKVLATDLDTDVVAHAKTGIYKGDRVTDLSPERKKKWFMNDTQSNNVKVKPSLSELITFKPLNLLHEWPMKGTFDVIFCRNVVIYFDKPTQKTLFDRFANQLAPKAHLFIGHSENLNKVSDRFDSLGKTIYQKRF